VEVTTNNATANGVAADVATAWAFDQYGNAVPGVAVTSTTGDADLTIGSATVTTAANGSGPISYTSTVADVYEASVFLGGVEIVFTPQPGSSLDTPEGAASLSSPVTLTFVPGVIDLALSTLVVTPTTQVVGSPVSVTATLRDGQGNAIPGVTVTLGTTGDSVLGVTSGVTNGSGVVATTLNDTKAETVSVTAKVIVNGVATDVTGSPTSVTFLPGVVCIDPCEPGANVDNDHRTRVEVTIDNQAADGVATDHATVWAFDVYGNAVSTVAITTTTIDTALTIPVTARSSAANGSADFDYTSLVAGDHVARVYIQGQEVIFTPQPGSALDTPEGAASKSSPITLKFVPGPIDPSQSSLVVDPTTQTVGEYVTATALVKDAQGNPIPNTPVTFAVTGEAVVTTDGTGPEATTITTVTLQVTTGADGRAVVYVTDIRAETIDVSATVTVAGSQVDVVGSPTAVTFTPGGLCIDPCVPDPGVDNDHRTRVDVTEDGSLADGKATNEVTVWAFDRYGNAIADVAVDTDALDSALRIEDVTDLTGPDGSATITYSATTGGVHKAAVTLNGIEVVFTPQPGSALDNPAGVAAHSSPATLTFEALPVVVQTGGWVASLVDAPTVVGKAFVR
jgi:adhesin/invasin